MHVADSSGVMREVVEAWVSDGSSWRSVVEGWTANSSGALQSWASFGGAVTVTVTGIDHLSFRIGWEAVDASQVALKVNGSTVYTAITASGSYVVSGQVPNTTVSVTATAAWTGVEKTSTAVLYTLPNIPAPSSVGWGSATSSSVVVSWAAVAGASSYEVCNAGTGAVLTTTANLTWTRTGLSAGTTYPMYVRARYDVNTVSVPSVSISPVTTASFPAGSYTFTATSADTKAVNYPSTWMLSYDSGTELCHGYIGTNRGVQTAFFFGYKDANGVDLATFFSGGAPVNITRVEVYVKRVNTAHGNAAAQLCRFYRHQHVSKPAQPSGASTTGDYYQNGTLLRGEAKWIDLPVAWGTDLVTGAVKGLAWGGTPDQSNDAQYIKGPSLSVLSTMMQIRITCG